MTHHKRAVSVVATHEAPAPGPADLHPVPGCDAAIAVGWRDSAADSLDARLVLVGATPGSLDVPPAYRWELDHQEGLRVQVLYRALGPVAVAGVAVLSAAGEAVAGGAWIFPRGRVSEDADTAGPEDPSPGALRAMLVGGAALPHIAGALMGGQLVLGLADGDTARPRAAVFVGGVTAAVAGEGTVRVVFAGTAGLPHPVALGTAVSSAALFAAAPRRVVATAAAPLARTAAAAGGKREGGLAPTQLEAALALGFSQVLRAVFEVDGAAGPEAVRAHLAACLTQLRSSGESHRVERERGTRRVAFTSAPLAPLPLACLRDALGTATGPEPALVELEVAADLPDLVLATGPAGDHATFCALEVVRSAQTGEVGVRISCAACAGAGGRL